MAIHKIVALHEYKKKTLASDLGSNIVTDAADAAAEAASESEFPVSLY